MAYKALTFVDEANSLSVSEVLTTNKVSITAEESDFDNPYAACLSFNLDYDDVVTLIDWLIKQKSFMEDNKNG